MAIPPRPLSSPLTLPQVEAHCCICKCKMMVDLKGCGTSTYICAKCFKGSR